MENRSSYDLILLGDSPGALLAGCLAAKLGFSVLALPAAGGEFRKPLAGPDSYFDLEGGFRLGLSREEGCKGLLAFCLEKAGALPAELSRILRFDALTQVVTPSGRFVFSRRDDATRFELEREFSTVISQETDLLCALSRSQAAFISYWLNFPKRLTLSAEKSQPSAPRETVEQEPSSLLQLRREILRGIPSENTAEKRWFMRGDLFTSLGVSKEGRSFCETMQGLWFALMGTLSQSLDVGDLMHALVLGRGGAFFAGGSGAYRGFLFELLKRKGARIEENLRPEAILVEAGRFVGVRTAEGKDPFLAKQAVLGLPLSRVSSIERKKTLFCRLKKGPQPAGWRFTVALTVKKEGVRPGMTPRMVWQEEGAPPLEIEMATPFGGEGEMLDPSVLFVRTVFPFTPESLEASFQKRMGLRMLKQVFEWIPFLEHHVVRIFPDFRAEDWDFRSFYGIRQVEDLPAGMRVYSATEAGVGSRSGIENLYVASLESYPEFGNFGETVAALESVATVAHRSGLLGPLLKV